ncbi:4Fe-4S binding domain-containing protein [uncultured delta proteobacterium]|uniref:4Fe-4S binding domain-containing protein n=1 Tax=uncultured delta proteobacterium TaxID=34034 RepID=A0A212JG95_9DELT|nr:4Fe-4S binding domain-containing protein [uncultured delta proteobacterium]
MAHHYNNSAYSRLAERLNRFPQGAPATPLLFSILHMLFSEEEAGLVAQLPIKPFGAAAAAKAWKRPLAESRALLDRMASKALLLDMDLNGEQVYCLPPPMAGFFEFAFMRVRRDIDQKTLAELLYQYINGEEDFMRALFVEGETGLGRVFAHESALGLPAEETAVPEEKTVAPAGKEAAPAGRLEVLEYERASRVIAASPEIGVSMCYCRHKKDHLGLACGAPMDICMTFNSAAHSLIKHGHARAVSKAECLDLLQQARDADLVQFGENNRQGVNFICNCCGCCCEALGAVKRFGILRTIHSNCIITLDAATCKACGKCAAVCPVGALHIPGGPEREGGKGKRPELRADICLGCGVCVRHCPAKSLALERRANRTITPLNTSHRVVLMAAERGVLQNLIFDNQVLASHRLAAAMLGAFLKLPPVARTLAQKQLRSRYIERLLGKL